MSTYSSRLDINFTSWCWISAEEIAQLTRPTYFLILLTCVLTSRCIYCANITDRIRYFIDVLSSLCSRRYSNFFFRNWAVEFSPHLICICVHWLQLYLSPYKSLLYDLYDVHWEFLEGSLNGRNDSLRNIGISFVKWSLSNVQLYIFIILSHNMLINLLIILLFFVVAFIHVNLLYWVHQFCKSFYGLLSDSVFPQQRTFDRHVTKSPRRLASSLVASVYGLNI